MNYFNEDLVVYDHSNTDIMIYTNIDETNLKYFEDIYNINFKLYGDKLLERIDFEIESENSLSKHYKFELQDENILILSHNNFDSIKNYAFKNFSNLINIELSNNSLFLINRNAFNGLKNLKILNLSKNKIKLIHKDAFNGLVNLNRLDLSYNLLKFIRIEHFIDLDNLNELNISFNRLESFYCFFKHEIDCFQCKLINPNNSIYVISRILNKELISYKYFNQANNLNLNTIKEIILDNCQIEVLENNVFKNLNNLTLINLKYNEITKIDKEIFNGLKQLASIYLQHNKITDIDKDIFYRLINLVDVDMHSNELCHIEQETFQGLFKLKNICLHNNILNKNINLYLEENVTFLSIETKRNNDLANIINAVIFKTFIENTKYLYYKNILIIKEISKL